MTDDGVGIGGVGPGQNGRDEAEGLGLRIMRYRADLFGGEIEFEPASGGGTRVVCRIPRSAFRQGGRGGAVGDRVRAATHS